MAVTTRNGAMNGTRGGASNPVVSGVVLNNVITGGGGITTSFSIMDSVRTNDAKTSGIQERTGSQFITNARKILSAGVFAFNSNGVISRITTSLATVARTNMVFMAAGAMLRPIAFFNHDFGARSVSVWLNRRFSWTGRLASGASKASRIMWLSSDGTSVSAPGSLTGVFMRDLRDGNSNDIAVDDAANGISRTFPGELVFQVNFVNKAVTGGNHFDYKPITGM